MHNDAEDEGTTALCKGLAFNNTIEELHLEFCAIEVRVPWLVLREFERSSHPWHVRRMGPKPWGSSSRQMVPLQSCTWAGIGWAEVALYILRVLLQSIGR